MPKRLLVILGILLGFILLVAGLQASLTPATAKPETIDSQGTAIIGQLTGTAQAVAVQGDHAYVGFESSFTVVDMSDKGHPILVGEVDMDEAIHDIAVYQEYAYVGSDSGLSVVDISEPTNPKIVATYLQTLVIKVLLSEKELFVLSRDGLEIFKLSEAPKLALKGFYDTDHANPHDLDLMNQYAFILDGHPQDYLSVIDISDRSDPRLVHSWGPSFLARAVAVSGDKLLDVESTCHSECHSWLNVLRWDEETWDLSYIGSHETYFSDSSRSVEAKDDLAYVGKDIGLFVFDIHENGVLGIPPMELAVYPIEGVHDMAFADGYLYTAGYDGFVIVQEYTASEVNQSSD